MPFFANQSREQLRQFYVQAWRKHRERAPLEPVEAQIVDVLTIHPEYQAILEDPEILNQDWLPARGATNPFLHMGLHLAVRDQVATDRPVGIRSVFQQLSAQLGSAHEAEHRMIDCLAETLWTAQRNGLPPDEQSYLAMTRRLLG